MTITRDESYPPEWAQLLMAFNRCSNDFPIEAVVDVAGNFLSMALKAYAEEQGWSAFERETYVQQFCDHIVREVCHPTPHSGPVVPMGAS